MTDMATAESPRESGDRSRLSTSVRCTWIDDRTICRWTVEWPSPVTEGKNYFRNTRSY